MTKEQINSIFTIFEKKTILIVGDVMIDTYIWGSVDRISPEAPVPVVSINMRENRLGGAANVALNIKAMGAYPIICSIIGDDDKGQTFLNLLKKRKMSKDGIIIQENRPTTSKTRVISNNHHLLRIDEETTEYLNSSSEKLLLNNFIKLLNTNEIDAIIFQDYNKGVLTSSFIEKAIKEANSRKIITCVDPKKKNFEIYKNVSLFKPNLKELAEGLNLNIDKTKIEDISNAAKKLKEKISAKNILITLSELGVFISNGKKYNHILSKAKDIVDVSGAGDTVIAIATLCLAAKLENVEIAKLSNIAGGLVCEKPGVVPVNKDELLTEYLKTI